MFHQHLSFGLSLLVGFYGLLRTGELLALQNWQIHMSGSAEPAVVSLGLTKSGKRQGAAESVTISKLSVLQLLWKWKQSAPTHEFLTAKPHVWRDMFVRCLEALGLDSWGFRSYSLRRGGATSLFVKVGSLDRVLLLGRWTAVKTAKIYLNSGLAMLADIKIPKRQLRLFHTVFANFVSSVQTHEPAQWSRAGGRGSKVKSSPKKAKMAAGSVKKTCKKCVTLVGCPRSLFCRPFLSLCLVPSVPLFGRGLGSTQKGGNFSSGLA